MATGPATEPFSKRPQPRRWRSALAALISIALAMSFLHGLDFDTGDGAADVASVQTGCDPAGKAPADWGAPHGDHCLAHVSTVATQDSAVPIEYVARRERLAAVLMPEAADLASPFKPPRA
ncbi:MAG: hypothetical protein U1E61_21920 [Bradyrhizobium sp.]